MSTINITLSKFDSEWDGSVGKAKKCSKSLNSASTIIGNVIDRLDREIIYSRNIHNDLNRVSRSIEEIEGRITDIRTFLLNAAQQYLAAQDKISKLHKEYDLPYKKNTWQKIKNVGKAIIPIGFSALGVVAAVAALGSAVGGVAVTFAVTGLIFALNDFISTTADKLFQQDVNILKSFFEGSGSFIGNFCGNKDLGKNIGNFLYNGLNIVTTIYTLTKSFTKLSDPKVKAPKMITKIAESKIVRTIENCVTGITNKVVGIAQSSKGLSFIQNNLIMPIKTITSVGVKGVKSLLSNPVNEMKRIIKPGTDFVVGLANKCKIFTNKKCYNFLNNLKKVTKITSANSVSGNVTVMEGVFNLIPETILTNLLKISSADVQVIKDGFKATSTLLKVGTSSEKFYKDLVTYVY